jgi:hypothetical protein
MTDKAAREEPDFMKFLRLLAMIFHFVYLNLEFLCHIWYLRIMPGLQKSMLLIILTGLFECPGHTQQQSIPDHFQQLDTEPQVIVCRNDLEINNQGGHLQGVQITRKGDAEYALVSGSSDTYAYYAVVKLGTARQVRSVNRLMYRPFKHAGGIQVYQELLVVGIEDNAARDKSKVCLYRITDPEEPSTEPLAVTERTGEPMRYTAGCCGIARMGDKYLLVVGDWDTKHLDFYLCDVPLPGQDFNAFDWIDSIDTQTADRSGWLDADWHPYQNINLLKDEDGKLYLIGFARDARNENLADLYLVEHSDLEQFKLKKLMTKSFSCQEGADFRSGAGILRQADGGLKVISCGPHIREVLILNVFE